MANKSWDQNSFLWPEINGQCRVIDIVFSEPATSQFYYTLWDLYSPQVSQVRSHPQKVFKRKGVEQVGVNQGLDVITFTTEYKSFQSCKSSVKILDTRKLAWNKFCTEYPLILGARYKILLLYYRINLYFIGGVFKLYCLLSVEQKDRIIK